MPCCHSSMYQVHVLATLPGLLLLCIQALRYEILSTRRTCFLYQLQVHVQITYGSNGAPVKSSMAALCLSTVYKSPVGL